ncbi:MAG: hypothetical protein FWG12_03465 [Holophagaceae bacterium]|nr:hypothetical protein [Holophagaceae bacterium]
MKVHKLLCAGAAFAMLGAHAQAQEEGNFFSGLKLRGGVQMYPIEDKLMQYYGGAAVEVGYHFGFGKLSAELGILYKPGRQYLKDVAQMQNVSNNPFDMTWSVDSRKNEINGMTFRVAYEKPMDTMTLRGGLQFGALKFRQEFRGDVRGQNTSSDAYFRDTYHGVTDLGGLTISPFVGISVPILTSHFVEVNFVGLNYKAADYVHVAGTELGNTDGQTKRDYIKEDGRLIPHIEVAFGFRF